MTTAVIWIDGAETTVPAGVPLGAILHRVGNGRLRDTPRSGAPRGLFCGMGTCFDCLVTIDGRHEQRACIVTVADGMRVETR